MKYFLFFVFFWPSFLSAQISTDTLHISITHSYPIVYGTNEDDYPDSLHISGVIKDVSFGVSCGVMCGSGTIKVRLSKFSHGFPGRYIFVVIPCLSGSNRLKFINKKVSVKVIKLFNNNRACYFRNISNTISSNSQPFYYYDTERYGPLLR